MACILSGKLIYIHVYSLFYMQWYVDADVSGELELAVSVSASSKTVRSGGYLILLQEQDSFSKFLFAMHIL